MGDSLRFRLVLDSTLLRISKNSKLSIICNHQIISLSIIDLLIQNGSNSHKYWTLHSIEDSWECISLLFSDLNYIQKINTQFMYFNHKNLGCFCIAGDKLIQLWFQFRKASTIGYTIIRPTSSIRTCAKFFKNCIIFTSWYGTSFWMKMFWIINTIIINNHNKKKKKFHINILKIAIIFRLSFLRILL
jgi:hypothetical protein